MIFTETPLPGAFVIDLEPHRDERGFFARTFCQHEFAAHGLKAVIAQSSISFSRHTGSVRGLHFLNPPAAETKLVACARGSMFDVIVDLRPESPAFLQHFAVELSAENRRSLYVPERFAHGYQVLHDNTETTYQIGDFHAPGAEGGLAYDDPQLAIAWPLPVTLVASRDRLWPHLDLVEADLRARMAPPPANA